MQNSMTILPVSAASGPAPVGPYSPAISTGTHLYTSGQIGPEEDGSMSGDVAREAERALANLDALLEAGGASRSSVIKTTIFLADMEDFATVNAIYADYFGEARPARSTVEVSRLPNDARVEIEAIALIEPVS